MTSNKVEKSKSDNIELSDMLSRREMIIDIVCEQLALGKR